MLFRFEPPCDDRNPRRGLILDAVGRRLTGVVDLLVDDGDGVSSTSSTSPCMSILMVPRLLLREEVDESMDSLRKESLQEEPALELESSERRDSS